MVGVDASGGRPVTASKIDKRVKNARLAVQRARTPEQKARAERDLATALRAKDMGKATKR